MDNVVHRLDPERFRQEAGRAEDSRLATAADAEVSDLESAISRTIGDRLHRRIGRAMAGPAHRIRPSDDRLVGPLTADAAEGWADVPSWVRSRWLSLSSGHEATFPGRIALERPEVYRLTLREPHSAGCGPAGLHDLDSANPPTAFAAPRATPSADAERMARASVAASWGATPDSCSNRQTAPVPSDATPRQRCEPPQSASSHPNDLPDHVTVKQGIQTLRTARSNDHARCSRGNACGRYKFSSLTRSRFAALLGEACA